MASQNNFVPSHLGRTICYSPGILEWSHYEVCLQMHHEKSRISFCSFVAIFAFILLIDHQQQYQHMFYSILKFSLSTSFAKKCFDLSQTYANINLFENKRYDISQENTHYQLVPSLLAFPRNKRSRKAVSFYYHCFDSPFSFFDI